MKISSRGQVTIPREVRERLGLLPNTEVELEERDGVLFLRKAGEPRSILDHLRGRGRAGTSTDGILVRTRGSV